MAAGGESSCWAPPTTFTPSTACCRPPMHTRRHWVCGCICQQRCQCRSTLHQHRSNRTLLLLLTDFLACITICPPLHPIAGNAAVDAEVYAQLRATGKFQEMSAEADEAEHSLELHLPYIVHIMAGRPFTLVPIVVGAVSPESGGCHWVAVVGSAGGWVAPAGWVGGRVGGRGAGGRLAMQSPPALLRAAGAGASNSLVEGGRWRSAWPGCSSCPSTACPCPCRGCVRAAAGPLSGRPL